MTLTQAATLTRRGIIVVIVLMILIISGTIGYNIWHKYYLSTLPPVEEKAEMRFGALPIPNFPTSSISSSNFSYSLDTTTGGFPQTPELVKVYFIPQTGVSLLAPERAKDQATKLDFDNNVEVLSQTQYKFKDDNNGILIIDLTTANFHLQRQLNLSDKNASGSASPEQFKQDQLINSFKSYLSSKNLLTAELQNGHAFVSYDKEFPDLSATAQVSLIPANFDNFPIVTSVFNEGMVKAIITKAEEEKNKFINVDYTFWSVDNTTFSTYPIKTAEQAFADLKSGLGFISLEPDKPQVSISSIYLAYFESEEYSPYLQPVFVFEGPHFAALVPAVKQ